MVTNISCHKVSVVKITATHYQANDGEYWWVSISLDNEGDEVLLNFINQEAFDDFLAKFKPEAITITIIDNRVTLKEDENV